MRNREKHSENQNKAALRWCHGTTVPVVWSSTMSGTDWSTCFDRNCPRSNSVQCTLHSTVSGKRTRATVIVLPSNLRIGFSDLIKPVSGYNIERMVNSRKPTKVSTIAAASRAINSRTRQQILPHRPIHCQVSSYRFVNSKK